MSTNDLTKMVKNWEYRLDEMSMRDLHEMLLAMATQIEANRKEIEKLKRSGESDTSMLGE